MNDLVRTLAFAFRNKGVDAMPGSELRMLLALRLYWFAPADAKRLVEHALAVGLLRAEGETLRPTFDVATVDIPLNFRPTLDVLEEGAPAALAPPAAPPRAPSGGPSDLERAAEDERRRRGLRLSLDVARLVVRRRAGEDVADEAAALEARLLHG